MTAVMAGGKSKRMGKEKSTLLLGGRSLIDRVVAATSPISERIAVIGGNLCSTAPVESVSDRYRGAGSMGGVATALAFAADQVGPDAWILCVACDMPFLSTPLLSYLFNLRKGFDIVAPRTAVGFEPLCSFYSVRTLEIFEGEIRKQNYRIRDVFGLAQTKIVQEGELRRFDPELLSFVNINSPSDFESASKVVNSING